MPLNRWLKESDLRIIMGGISGRSSERKRGGMSQLSAQSARVRVHIAACQDLERKVSTGSRNKGTDQGSIELRLKWIKDALAAATREIGEIDPVKVESNRRQELSTENLLEEHVEKAESQFQNKAAGIFQCLDELATEYNQELPAQSLLDLEALRKRSKKAVRLLHLMTRPKLAFLLSWRFALIIFAFGLVATAAFYTLHYASHPEPGTSRTQTVKAEVARDVKTVKDATQEPNASTLDRALGTVNTILDVLPKVPKAILALTAIIASLQRLGSLFLGFPKNK